MEKEKQRNRQEEGEKKDGKIRVKIIMQGKEITVLVPVNTKLSDALKTADIDIGNLKNCLMKLNGKIVEIDKVDPTLESDSLVIISRNIVGGRSKR